MVKLSRRKYVTNVDLANTKIGNWSVLRSEKVNNRLRWVCKCICGEERSVLAISLVLGKSKSCGCVQTPRIKPKRFCKVEGCGKIYFSKDFCSSHYNKMHYYGDPLKGFTSDNYSKNLVEKFSKLQCDECVEWPLAKDRDGYGVAIKKKKGTPAHRAILIAVKGQPPTEKHHAAHNCGNPSCCNPRHLRWATAKENCADRVIHKTIGKGPESVSAVLQNIGALS